MCFLVLSLRQCCIFRSKKSWRSDSSNVFDSKTSPQQDYKDFLESKRHGNKSGEDVDVSFLFFGQR